jgi:hypothetical protein
MARASLSATLSALVSTAGGGAAGKYLPGSKIGVRHPLASSGVAPAGVDGVCAADIGGMLIQWRRVALL